LFLGSWGFDGAPGIACLCLVAAAYLYFAGRERRPAIPDSAAILDKAIRLAASGETGRAIALLNEALRLSPASGRRGNTAVKCVSENRTPQNPRSRTSRRLFGWRPANRISICSAAVSSPCWARIVARADLEAAARLGGDTGAPAGP